MTTAEPSLLRRYGFDDATTAALVCGRCGTFVGVMLSDAKGDRMAINVNCLENPALFKREPLPLDYDAETAEARSKRRRQEWTTHQVGGCCAHERQDRDAERHGIVSGERPRNA